MIDCQKMCRTLEGAQAIVRTMMDNQEEKIARPLEISLKAMLQAAIEQFPSAVQDGEIYMESAECPDQICVEHGPLRPGGTPIVCLPNRLSIQWIERDAAVDAVSGGR